MITAMNHWCPATFQVFCHSEEKVTNTNGCKMYFQKMVKFKNTYSPTYVSLVFLIIILKCMYDFPISHQFVSPLSVLWHSDWKLEPLLPDTENSKLEFSSEMIKILNLQCLGRLEKSRIIFKSATC
jgi:hypothetical protein